MDGHAVRLHSLRGRALYVAPIRVRLGALWLAVAHLAGVTTGFGVAGLLRAFRLDPGLWWDGDGSVYRR